VKAVDKLIIVLIIIATLLLLSVGCGIEDEAWLMIQAAHDNTTTLTAR